MKLMSSASEIRKLAFLGNYLPRKCGIATFTADLCESIAAEFPRTQCFAVPVNDLEEGYDYPSAVRFEIQEQEPAAYDRAADFLNNGNVGAVSLQHEFGIFGGPAGSHVIQLLRSLKMPVVTTFHTILREPNTDQRRVTNELLAHSTRVVVMSQIGQELLQEIYDAPVEKIDVIPHGIPDMPFV